MIEEATFSGTIIKETPKAILFSNGYKRAWFPKASIWIKETSERRTAPRSATIILSAYKAKEAGFCL